MGNERNGAGGHGGPASNVLFAIVLLGVAAHSGGAASSICAQAVRLSMFLAIFNMIPVPPLDGSKLLLAARVPFFIYVELARFGFLLILIAMTATSLGAWMSRWSLETTEMIFHWWA